MIKQVCDAFNRQLDVRTFNHGPLQQDWMGKGLKRVNGVRAMIKEVPQDWQPYYPMNPLIGDARALERLSKIRGGKLVLADAARIRGFVKNLRGRFTPTEVAADPDVNIMSQIRAVAVDANCTTITWNSQRPGRGCVQWGTHLPMFVNTSAREQEAGVAHRVIINGLEPKTRYVFQVLTDENISGDFDFTTR